MYDEYHRIDIIMKGRLQRKVRKAFFEYKKRKEEKRRKKEEEAAQKNKRFGGRKNVAPKQTVPAPA